VKRSEKRLYDEKNDEYQDDPGAAKRRERSIVLIEQQQPDRGDSFGEQRAETLVEDGSQAKKKNITQRKTEDARGILLLQPVKSLQ